MDWIIIVINLVAVFLLGLFIRDYLPTYMSEKGKNLATKEDIQEITRKTEEVQKEFKESFEYFSSDLSFRYDFYYNQYSELYSHLYAIIIQSEYVRHFMAVSDDQNVPFDEAPFLEISPTRRVNEKTTWRSDKPTETKRTEEIIETSLSQFNKEQLCEYIISNGKYASQNLLKLAVSYRFAHHYYGGNASCADAANAEEFSLIKRLVCCIVSEYNQLRKDLKMSYDDSELETGIPHV